MVKTEKLNINKTKKKKTNKSNAANQTKGDWNQQFLNEKSTNVQ